MLDLNIQTIAKWFEKGCSQSVMGDIGGSAEDSINKNCGNNKTSEKGFYILECNDICLLSKLADVKNQTLLERAQKQLVAIEEPVARKDFLLTICNEFMRDGRRAVLLKMITNEIDTESELFRLFRADLLFHRALCYLKNEQPTKALSDLYAAFHNGPIESLDKVHVQILEEIKKCFENRKLKDGYLLTERDGRVTFEQILKQYESEICHFIKRHMEKPAANKRSQNENENTIQLLQQPQPKPEKQDKLQFSFNSPNNVSSVDTNLVPSYKSKLVGIFDQSSIDEHNEIVNNACLPLHSALTAKQELQQPQHTPDSNEKEIILTYSVGEQHQVIHIQPNTSERMIDNIFNLRAILVDKLCPDVQLTTVCKIFGQFGAIVNVRYRENSAKLIIEYDNPDSPRFAITYLSQVSLPYVSECDQCLEFRFHKSENQKNLRICKQNQIKTSRECYFWRTTGCQNGACKFYHNKLARGVDYQDWMKIEQLRSLNRTAEDRAKNHSSGGSGRTTNNRGGATKASLIPL